MPLTFIETVCGFQWDIIGRNSQWKKGEGLKSPTFIAKALGNTKWALEFYPKGYDDKSNACFYLYREQDCNGPFEIDVSYELFLMGGDLTNVTPRIALNYKFRPNVRSPPKKFKIENIFKKEREIDDDIFMVQCNIRPKEIKLMTFPINPIRLQTVSDRYFRGFEFQYSDFCNLKPGYKCKSLDREFIDFDIVVNETPDLVKTLDIDIISFVQKLKYISFEILILNSKQEKEFRAVHRYFTCDLKKGIASTQLSGEFFMENKKRYFLNGKIKIIYNYILSEGTVLRETGHKGIFSPKVTKVLFEKEKHQSMAVLLQDLKTMYTDEISSDLEFRTSTKTFKTHKFILMARSPVFRRMFSNDMSEKNSGQVNIEDLDADTVHRMLLYMYTDALDDLQLESACKLYEAADKYEVLALRNRCSSFLKHNLCSNNACEILVLADQHKDEDLKSAVKDFISRDDGVFGSLEWKRLMTTNLQLAADIMYGKVYPGSDVTT